MIFTELSLKGAFLIEPQMIEDERGFFARIVCEEEFKRHGLMNLWAQQGIAFNHRKGTLRGLHYQKEPYAEIKLVRCTQGAIYDVLVDLRYGSPTYKQWVGLELSAKNHFMAYLPKGFAHGYITLSDCTEVSYLISEPYHPEAGAGIRYDDACLKINWPGEISCISERDKGFPSVGVYDAIQRQASLK